MMNGVPCDLECLCSLNNVTYGITHGTQEGIIIICPFYSNAEEIIILLLIIISQNLYRATFHVHVQGPCGGQVATPSRLPKASLRLLDLAMSNLIKY